MKTSLYNLSEECVALDKLLEMDSGEMTIEHENLVEELGKLLEDKTDSIVHYKNKIEDEIDAGKKRKKEIELYIKGRENSLERIKNYAALCMERSGKEEFKGKFYRIKFRKPSQILSISHEDLVPAEYLTTQVKIDRAALKEAVKNKTVEIEGISLEDGKKGLIFAHIPVTK